MNGRGVCKPLPGALGPSRAAKRGEAFTLDGQGLKYAPVLLRVWLASRQPRRSAKRRARFFVTLEPLTFHFIGRMFLFSQFRLQ
jgi:hypothetical protein